MKLSRKTTLGDLPVGCKFYNCNNILFKVIYISPFKKARPILVEKQKNGSLYSESKDIEIDRVVANHPTRAGISDE